MNILLIGANGFVGNQIFNAFNKRYNIFCLDIDIPQNSTIDYIRINLLNDKEVQSFITTFQNKINIIINLASIFVNSSNNRNIEVLYNNIKITQNVIQIAKAFKVEKIINFSSIAVYPGITGTYNENSIIDPSVNFEGLYGLSKFNSEVLFNLILSETNIQIYNLRCAQILGEGMRSDRIFSILKKELEENNTITLYGNGERVSNFIKINTLLFILDLFIRQSIKSGTYNVGEKNISYLELANNIIKKYGNHNSKIIKIKNGNNSKFNLDTSKLDNIMKNQEK